MGFPLFVAWQLNCYVAGVEQAGLSEKINGELWDDC